MILKSFTLKIQAQVIDHDGAKEVVKQEFVFDGRAPAIHNAIEKMGASFIYGLSVSLSREMLGLLDEKKKKDEPRANNEI